MCHFEPLVLQSFLATESLFLVQDEKLADQVLALLGDILKLHMVKVIICLFDLAEDLSGVIALEWKITANQRVEEHTERPDVRLFAVGTFEHFWRHVVRCARHRGQLAIVSRGFGQAEVDQPHRIVVCDHDIVRLNITMNNVLGVTMIDSLEQTFHVTRGDSL